MSRLETTIFASLGRGCRCKGQAFFDKYLSIRNRMAVSSCCRQTQKSGGSDFSKPPEISMMKDCYTTAFFLLPSCGSFSNYSIGSPKNRMTIHPKKSANTHITFQYLSPAAPSRYKNSPHAKPAEQFLGNLSELLSKHPWPEHPNGL